ncbi:Ras GTPase-activating-like protein rng2 [Madurella mycetomatis]|uniref:Ras GTPase-activating-like protein rng2 n=1 Tax=Madurella mycetomatis TaxID=100816 RepID=A0A175VUG7_9PEZI|nr:Ras GTPase-activating-like protein rng2 [Madurella mycetomatis]
MSSYRPHPLRQSQTADYVFRQPSNASSSASSGYSNASSGTYEFSRTPSTMSSSPSSVYSAYGHKRGLSEVSRRPPALNSSHSSPTSPMPENIYHAARQSLRPLPQVPRPVTPPRSTHRHDRGHSVDIGRLSLSDHGRTSPTPPAPLTPPTPPPRSSVARPTSMLMTRSDTVRLGGDASPPPLVHAHTAPLTTPDLERLGRSSTNQLRTLSKLAQSGSADEFAITSQAQEVVGLRGRRRLQRTDKTGSNRPAQRTGGYGWEGRNWMDKQRQFLQAYEYLCHIGEAKEWIEDVIQRTIPPIVELEEALRDGVTLAEVVESLNPHRRLKIFRHPRLQYRHSDNIAIFFRYLDEVQLPDLFRFELIDLKGIVAFRIGNLVGQLEFEHHELEATQKGLDKLGANMPSFGNMGADFGVEETPEPEETEEERIDRELAENEEMVVDLQAQIRGAVVRLRLGDLMQHLWDSEDWLIDLQSRIRGDFTRQIMGYRLQMKRFATSLQSAARGFLVRRQQAQTERFWKSTEKDILSLQSLVRANKVRNEVREQHSQLMVTAGPIRDIQATLRGFLLRERMHAQQQEVQHTTAPVVGLQAAVRGLLLRKQLDEDLEDLQSQAGVIADLQAAARAALTRNQVALQKEALESLGPMWEVLQSACRGNLARCNVEALKTELHEHSPSVGLLQSHIRAAAVRREISEKLESLGEAEDDILALQSMIRGMLERKRLSELLDDLDQQTVPIIDLQSRIRGSLCRQQHQNFLGELQANEEEVASLQSLARAMLLRGNVAEVLDQLEENEESIGEIQAAAKAFVVRAKFEEKKRFFNENMQKVVKIQSFVRAKLQGEAYKSLTSGKNPPVNAVKNFVHLLNDSDFDFNEEVEFERLRKTVVQQVRQNEMLEQYIDQLDIKIALLVKNKITLDEVVRHQSNFGGHTSSLLANSSIASANQFDLKALNKSSRKKLESYQQLFFALQTQPQYLARLFKRVREQGTTEKECKRIEHLMMGLFGYAQKRREEYYLLKLIGRSIREEVEACSTLQDYLRGKFFWTRLFHNYTRSPRDRKYLRDLLGPLIRDNIIEDPELDLESDPMQIYRSAINNEELRTGRPSNRPLDIPRELAIKDPETKAVFIDHLRDLREICDQFLLALEDLLPRMPYGLRFMCRQTFDALCQRFQRERHQRLLQIVCNWLWKSYLQPALTAPENVGVVDKQLSPLQKRNLGEVAKVLSQIASGRQFGGDNIYLQPLNAFIGESIERLAVLTENLINVPDAESTFDIDEFNDLYAKNKPTLYIKMTDIFAIHSLIAAELPHLIPNRDDMLREIMQDLGSAKHNESEMTAAGSSDIQMFLTPKLHELEDPDADVKALFMETKRCILYIIRVQTGTNLLEILVKPISPEDEHKWQMLLRDDFSSGSNTRGAYSDANMVDVTRMSYYDLKRIALENIMRLEHMGRISRHNYYQDVLNAIAVDIRTKSRRRVQRQRELEGVRLTLGNLHEKAKYLEQQRKSYDDYIEQAMATLQNKKGKKRFLLPFTKQYNHQRELERSGRVPKFGSYKYSARALSDKGVLVSWSGIHEREWSHINLTISCDEVGVFSIEGSRGHIQIPGASALVPIEDLLQAQFEAHQFMNLFEGGLKLNVNLLLHLLYKKFYRTQ